MSMGELLNQADEKFNFPDDWDGEDVNCFAMRYMINNLEADYFDDWGCDEDEDEDEFDEEEEASDVIKS